VSAPLNPDAPKEKERNLTFEMYPFLRKYADFLRDFDDPALPLLDETLQHIVRSNHIAIPLTPVLLSDLPYFTDNSGSSSLTPTPFIVFDSEFVCKLSSDDELAFFIAHELAHIVLRHQQSEKMLRKEIAKVPKYSGAIWFRHARFREQWEMSWYRHMEFEADRLGAVYASKAGYDPHVMFRYFEEAESPKEERKPFWDLSVYYEPDLRLHPADAARVRDFHKFQPMLDRISPKAQPVRHLTEIKKILGCR